MITPGTLCLLLAPHSLAGRCCTVVRPAPVGARLFSTQTEATLIVTGDSLEFYEISIDVPCPRKSWAAHRPCLLPLTPPGLTTRERNEEPVAA